MTKTETYLFYVAVASSVLSVLLLVGFFFTTSGTFLSSGTLGLLILSLFVALISSGVYYYEKTQDASTYVEPKHDNHVIIDRNPWIIPLKGCIHE